MLIAGLEARRLRRREKAEIRKDKTKAVVASAAEEGSRIRAKVKAKRRKARKSKGEEAASSEDEPRPKKRKRTTTTEAASRLRDIHQRPNTITRGRLTVSRIDRLAYAVQGSIMLNSLLSSLINHGVDYLGMLICPSG